jgi:carboxylesterase type B
MQNLDLGALLAGGKASEDCLFLDIVVPGKAFRKEAKVPVVNWIYGGAYILGTKDLDGSSVVTSSKGNLIFVSGNYRLGALGFLGGSTIEKDKTATANAGFYDQRAVLEWIQKNIGLFGGDRDNVTVWVHPYC